jgi:simple sugar transport system permease protein
MIGRREKSFWRGWKVEPRQQVSRSLKILSVVLAFLAALLISSLLLLTARVNLIEAFGALFIGAFGNWRSFMDTLARASPLILTGLAATLAFRGKVWNIGGEGQLVGGAMAAFLAFTLFSELPRPVFYLLVLVFSFTGGALFGAISGVLKVRFNVDEIISTVMMNYIILYFLSFMLSAEGPWREPGSYYQQTVLIPVKDRFPVLFPRSEVHLGFLVALLCAMLIKIVLDITPLGYEIRALGFNAKALKFKGTNISKLVVVTLLLSGGLAGLAGAGELFGVQHRLVMDLSNGLGYSGIIVAMLAGLDPVGVALAALLFGGLINGAYRLQTVTGVPSAFVDAIQAIVLLCVLASFVLSRYQIRRVVDVEPDLSSSDHR